ncbi:MAG: hypothetical protein LBK41_00060 [Clostridiales bacterium]|jgi:hypothetical protein|nr:hypothetical protein [Clostridiales bacterium]
MARTSAKCLLALIIGLCAFLTISASVRFADSSNAGAAARIEQAVARAAAACYSLEGAYPSDIRYLADHYGVILNEDEFIYHYSAFGDNVRPDVKVIPRD